MKKEEALMNKYVAYKGGEKVKPGLFYAERTQKDSEIQAMPLVDPKMCFNGRP